MKYAVNTRVTLIGLVSVVIWVAIPYPAHADMSVFENISSDTAWHTGEVYIVYGNIAVNPGVALTIEPGAIVKFNYEASLTVFGELTANGTSDNKIYFTAIRDDSVGGDTNGDGSAASPQIGDWAKITVAAGASVNLKYSTVRFGGTWPQYTNIFQSGGTLNVSNSTFEFSNNGFRIAGGATIIENSLIKDNHYGLEAIGPGSLILNNNTFTNNITGSAFVSFNEGKSFVSSGNTASGNGQNGIVVFGAMGTDQTWTDQMPYIVLNLTIPSGKTLTINAGTKVKFNSEGSMTVSGDLNVNGISGNEVYFTSLLDDSAGGDTNNNGFSSGARGDWNHITIASGANVNLNHSVVRFGGGGWPVYSNISLSGGSLLMSDSVVSSGGTGLRIYGGWANINGSTITGNSYGILIEGGGAAISNSSVYDNKEYGIYNGTFVEMNAENNWWGDVSGPYNFWNNSGGQGDKVSTWVDFDPWLTASPVSPPSPVSSKEPVIIVPGILGSRLNRVSDGGEVWPNSIELIKPGSDLYLTQLKLDNLGNEILDIASTGILEREFLVFPFYENLIEKFEDEGYVRDSDLIIFDYDWRKDISSLALQLKEIIDTKSSSSPTGKVNIVAHSMGSLLAKEYLRQNESNLSSLNKVVFAGSPQFGAIKAFKLINFGDNLNIPILNPNAAKDISQNMPAIYQLLPSREYIIQGGGYVEDHRNGQNRVLNYDEVNDFMLNDPYLPDHRNELLLNIGEQFHQNLDDLNINGPEITNLVGCSVDTLAGIKIYDKKKVDISMKKGDGTVPFTSAKHIFSSQNQINYYAVRGLNHFDLVSDDQALSLITAVVTGQAVPNLSDISSSDSICQFNAKKFFLFSTHSPVNLRLYDEQDNYVGLNEDGDINIGIPESDFIRIGENNFVLVPEGRYRAVVDAYATGSFDFKIRVLSDDNEDSAVYLNIPIDDPALNAEAYFSGEFEDILLNIDNDGDGGVDSSLAPNFIIFRSSAVTIEDIVVNVEGAYELGWIENKARKYLIKKLEHVNKLEEKDEPKDDEIQEILNSLLTKLDDYLRRDLVNNQAYDIIKGDIIIYKSL